MILRYLLAPSVICRSKEKRSRATALNRRRQGPARIPGVRSLRIKSLQQLIRSSPFARGCTESCLCNRDSLHEFWDYLRNGHISRNSAHLDGWGSAPSWASI